MLFNATTPLLLSTLVGTALGLSLWALWQAKQHPSGIVVLDARNDVLLWMLVLSGLTLVVFLAYIVAIGGS